MPSENGTFELGNSWRGGSMLPRHESSLTVLSDEATRCSGKRT